MELTDGQKLDLINDRLKKIQLRQNIQVLLLVLGAFGIIAYVKKEFKKI